MGKAGVINVCAIAICLLISICPAAFAQNYVDEEPVEVRGYDGDLMEPFVSRDGKFLFFNNNNKPGDKTDIHIAEFVGGAFVYRGPLEGANSKKLDGVPTMDRQGRFYFISMRAYDETKSTVYTGDFVNGGVQNVRLVKGAVSRNKAPWFNMDVEASANGERLYATDNLLRFRLFGGVSRSDLFAAERDGHEFHRLENTDEIFEKINTNKLEYAAAISEDEKTLFFNRTDIEALRKGNPSGIGIYVARRENIDAPFGEPRRVGAITGFVEGATISSDGCTLYYHRKTDGVFSLYKVTREDCIDP